jgi:hypothetical protein
VVSATHPSLLGIVTNLIRFQFFNLSGQILSIFDRHSAFANVRANIELLFSLAKQLQQKIRYFLMFYPVQK